MQMNRCTKLVALTDICLAQKGLLFKGCNYFSLSLYQRVSYSQEEGNEQDDL